MTVLIISAVVFTAAEEERRVKVFVALCDNATQGIVKVGEKIGDGDVPDANLYWGCSDGLGAYFKKSRQWKLIESANDVSPVILRRVEFAHADGDVTLVADAYRGSEMRQCLEDFEQAAAANTYDLVAFIGHNGLMDFRLPELEPLSENDTDVIVLACLSDSFFSDRLGRIGCRPILMTRELMYPGSFILHDAIEVWKDGGDPAAIREAAGRAYGKNQSISAKAGRSIFSVIP